MALKYQVFISSVQGEFAEERKSLYDFIRQDTFLKMFFEPVIFEELSASGYSPKEMYLSEIEKSDIYVGLFGADYGFEDEEGISPTEREFDYAQEQNLPCWIFIKGNDKTKRHEKMIQLIKKAESCISRKRFMDMNQLKKEIAHSCAVYLKQKGNLHLEDFDSSTNNKATLDDIADEAVTEFVITAKNIRKLPLKETDSKVKVLTHLKMHNAAGLTNSAILVFGKVPQAFFPTAIVKCAHFHGNTIEKPIPDFKEFGGTVFQMTDDAVDFVLSKISVSRGDRSISNRVETVYEIPRSIISEAVINAIAHRDYFSNGSIQVSVFKNRIEIENPGSLPIELDVASLRKDHSSYPHNPLLANCMFLAGTIERFGTGIPEMFAKSKERGLKAPVFSVEKSFKVTLWRPSAKKEADIDEYVFDDEFLDLSPVQRVVLIMNGEMRRDEIQDALELKHRNNFRDVYLNPALDEGYLAMTIPDKPTSSKQMYRLTKKGTRLQNSLKE